MKVYKYHGSDDYIVYVMDGNVIFNAPGDYNEEMESGMRAVGAELIIVKFKTDMSVGEMSSEDEGAFVAKIYLSVYEEKYVSSSVVRRLKQRCF